VYFRISFVFKRFCLIGVQAKLNFIRKKNLEITAEVAVAAQKAALDVNIPSAPIAAAAEGKGDPAAAAADKSTAKS
jgi:hypothetical protein